MTGKSFILLINEYFIFHNSHLGTLLCLFSGYPRTIVLHLVHVDISTKDTYERMYQKPVAVHHEVFCPLGHMHFSPVSALFLPYALVISECSVMIFMSLMIMINDGGKPSFCEIRLRCIIASRRSFSTAAYRE